MSDTITAGDSAATSDISAPSDTLAELYKVGQALDMGMEDEEYSAPKPDAKPSPAPAPAAPADKSAPSKDAAPAADATKPDQSDASTKADASSDYAAKRAEQQAKDAARREKTWQQLNADKEALARERAELERLRSEVSARAKPAEPARDDKGYTAEDYERFAAESDRDGDPSLAKAARDRAAKLRAAAPASASPADTADEATLVAEARELMRADPELTKPDNPVVQEANRLMSDPATAAFFRRPGGVRFATEAARLVLQARAAEGAQKALAALTSERDSLRAEVESLRRKTAVGSAPASNPPGASALDNLSPTERLNKLYELARAVDGE